jgi:GTP cyclohydrolase IA
MPDTKIKGGLVSLLSGLKEKLGFPDDDPNFLDTPDRVFRAYEEMLLSPDIIEEGINSIFSKTFPTPYEGHVIWPDISTFGMCPHHLLPVEYEVTIAYLPHQQKVIGLSKPIRLARLLACRPVMQETYTQEIADTITKRIDAKGAAVITRGLHGCMKCRGVRANSPVIMAVMKNSYMDDPALRQEMFDLLKLYR